MAQDLDPKSDGRVVLQFKTGLMSVIKVLIQLVELVFSDFFYLLLNFFFLSTAHWLV